VRWRIFTVFFVFLATCSAWAQERLVDAPSLQPSSEMNHAVDEVQPVSPAPKPVLVHKFWDRTNILLFSGVAIFRGLDYASTRNMQARGRKEILLAPEVVNNDAAFASLEAAGAATSIGISYIFHRTGHHTLERWLSIGHISVTGFGAARNYCLLTKSPR
jgi:hypothetical protein